MCHKFNENELSNTCPCVSTPFGSEASQQCYQIEIHKNPESRPKKSQNAVVFLKKSRDFSELHDDVISFLYFIERVIIVYG